MTRLGVVSDTHGHLANTLAAVRCLRQRRVDVVLHCGDIGSTQIVSQFADWPTHFVFGNVDRDVDELEFAIRRAGQNCHGRFGELELDGIRIALLHGDDASAFAAAVGGGEFDLICSGHTHRQAMEREGRAVLLNPGALYRATPHTIATVDLPSLEIRFVTVE